VPSWSTLTSVAPSIGSKRTVTRSSDSGPDSTCQVQTQLARRPDAIELGANTTGSRCENR
jgi:hypothetical protein